MLNKRKCGILLHPTSMPSPYGIGDLGQGAYEFIDFLEKSGQKLWQALPIGPTGYGNSPYQSFSAFAGNFLLISPDMLFEEGLLCEHDFKDKPQFDDSKVDFGSVIGYKTILFKKAFQKFNIKDIRFKSFCTRNAGWLNDYALFSALKEHFMEIRKNGIENSMFKCFAERAPKILDINSLKDLYFGGVWNTWPEELVKREPETIKKYETLLSEEIRFFKFLQFKFFTQWLKLKEYAASKNIEIIGDIPIFAAYDSADVWANQNLFELNESGFPINVAGVPPDYFSSTGQLWGNPLYVWKNHAETGYDWWIKRVKNQLSLFDILRIDHFRGFESYYSIPFGNPDATCGKWMKGPGRGLFDAIKKELGSLPIIAEDLGVITPPVAKLRQSLNLPGMKILQFAFDNSENNQYLPHNYDKNCVVYTGTHDNDTTVGWYNAADESGRDYFRRYMNSSGNSPSWDLIRLAVSSCAYTAIYPLQDVLCLGASARMNTPGTNGENWLWRYAKGELLESHAVSLKYLTKIFKR